MSVRDMRMEQADVRAERLARADHRAIEEEAERENPLSGNHALEGGRALHSHLTKLHGGSFMTDFLKGILSEMAESHVNDYLGDKDISKGKFGKLAKHGVSSAVDSYLGPSTKHPLDESESDEEAPPPPRKGKKRTQKPVRSQQLESYDNGPKFSQKPMGREDSELMGTRPGQFARDMKQARAYGSYMNDNRGKVLPTPAELGGFYNPGRINKPENQMIVQGSGKGRAMRGAGPISDLGIPFVSGLAGMFGLGKKGKKSAPDGEAMEGGGPISSLGIPLVSGLAGMFGLGERKVGGVKTGRYEGQGASGGKAKRPASEKAKARGALVSKLMKEKGMSLGEASRHIKEKGLL